MPIVHEAHCFDDIVLKEPKQTALQFLYKKGMEFINAGPKAEQEGELEYAQFKYSKAIDILSPLVYHVEANDNTAKIRVIYDQILLRMNAITNQSSSI